MRLLHHPVRLLRGVTTIRIFWVTCVVCLMGVFQAIADTHHNGHSLLGGRININGKHRIHNTGIHSAHAHVDGGKIKTVSVVHNRTGRAVSVRKYKTARRLHAGANPGAEVHYVMMETEAAGETTFVSLPDGEEVAQLQTVYVGFGFVENGQLIIFWFPVQLVFGGDQDAFPI